MDSEGPSAGPSSLTDAQPRKRPQYDAAQIGIIERCCQQTPKLGAKAILKKYPDMGFSLEGLKSAVARLHKFGNLERKTGSGRKRTRRTPEATEAAKAYFEGSKFATAGEAARDLNIPKTTVRRIISEDLDLKPLRQITTQRVRPQNFAKRLEICKIWDEQIRNGSLDVEKIYFTDEKVFRLGACAGGEPKLCCLGEEASKEERSPKRPNSERGRRVAGRGERNGLPRPLLQSQGESPHCTFGVKIELGILPEHSEERVRG